MPVMQSYNFRKISDSITTSGVVQPEQLASLGAEAYEAVINLLPDSSEYAVADEASIVDSQAIEYIYIPVDFAAPSTQDFERFETAVDSLIEKKVHIHCAANYRVSVFYSLYAERRGLWSRERSAELINSLWDPDSYPGWPEFMRQVRDGNP